MAKTLRPHGRQAGYPGGGYDREDKGGHRCTGRPGFYQAAYKSGAGIMSVHKGQWEAAHTLGFSTFDTYRCVILPQALRRIVPPLTGQAISLVKDSALVSTIAVYDLTMQGQAIIAETYLTFELWFIVAAIYLMLTVTLSVVVNLIENRLRVET